MPDSFFPPLNPFYAHFKEKASVGSFAASQGSRLVADVSEALP